MLNEESWNTLTKHWSGSRIEESVDKIQTLHDHKINNKLVNKIIDSIIENKDWPKMNPEYAFIVTAKKVMAEHKFIEPEVKTHAELAEMFEAEQPLRANPFRDEAPTRSQPRREPIRREPNRGRETRPRNQTADRDRWNTLFGTIAADRVENPQPTQGAFTQAAQWAGQEMQAQAGGLTAQMVQAAANQAAQAGMIMQTQQQGVGFAGQGGIEPWAMGGTQVIDNQQQNALFDQATRNGVTQFQDGQGNEFVMNQDGVWIRR